MARSRMTKGAALAALDQLIAEGERLVEASAPDCAWPDGSEEAFAIANLGIDRMVWAQSARALFPQMSKGMQLAADFRRVSAGEGFVPAYSLADDRLRLHEGLRGELGVLKASVDRWRRSGTRPLNESATGPIQVGTGPMPGGTGPMVAKGGGTAPMALDALPLEPLPPLPPPPPPPVPRLKAGGTSPMLPSTRPAKGLPPSRG